MEHPQRERGQSVHGKMMNHSMALLLRVVLAVALVLSLGPASFPAGAENGSHKSAGAAGKPSDVVLETMQGELARATKELAKAENPPYFIGYSVYDQDLVIIVGSYGSLLTSASARRREADVTMRVGSPALDNTHGDSRQSGMTSGLLPVDDNRDAIARVLWELTDREYKRAAPTYLNVKTDSAVRAAEEDKSPDFSKETAQNHAAAAPGPLQVDRKVWENKIRSYSEAFRKYPEVYSSTAILQIDSSTTRFASSEGAALTMPSASARLVIQAETRAEDGMELLRVETFQAPSAKELPADAEIQAKIEKMAADLKALRAAPVAEPFNGPAMLSGRAAAVFFHEVLGHRLEGHRQRSEEEGQTFTKKVGQAILPEFLSVADDPTLQEVGGVKLAGSYAYDNEGVPAQHVDVIQNGILKSFLMSRMPIKGFSQSNGHGRNQAGRMPTGRQGNLIVTSSKTVPEKELREKLIEEVKKQGKPYGLYFDDVQGGFTLTTRALPQAFQVLPVMVYRVYADGRPDELVRGVDIVGTPLAALTRILLTGDTERVFNGVCGAESGSVPVSAAAPAMLFSEMEVQKRAHSHTRPPLLPPPGFEQPAPPSEKTAQGSEGQR
ncbi:MAG TPA: metallopeptidase TldD-related protein [Candidatus Acidoferrales bacterium]|nr:metallopeptidase TldD-related protein [Candidatus Acidoferrales bacterium]